MTRRSESDDAAAEAREDQELLAIADQRMRAVLNGTDRLIPLAEVMRDFGLTPADEPDDEEWFGRKQAEERESRPRAPAIEIAAPKT